jgi:hypothetical protein
MLRWLKINCILGTASQDWQLTFLGTCLISETHEWYICNVESSTQTIQVWNLETVILSLQTMLRHRHAAMDFDVVYQRNGTVQELYNLMNTLAKWMVHLPNTYTFM